MKKQNVLLGVLLVGIVLLGLLLHPLFDDQWEIWDDGLSWMYVVSDTKYTLENEPVEGTYSVELNLDDLESNIGKDVFENGRSQRIMIDAIEKMPESNEYLITLYSWCKYNVFGGKLVTFFEHNPRGGVEPQFVETANVVVHYEGQEYPCSLYSCLQLMRHEGDLCTYQVTLPEDANMKENNTAVLTINNLTENIWKRNWSYRE